MILNSRRRNDARRRSGLAVVEMAICLPVVVMLVFGTIEACSMIFLQQSLTAAAYEGTSAGTKCNGSTNTATTRCQQVLDAHRVASATIELSPPTLESASQGSPVTVTVSASCGANGLLPLRFYVGRTLTAHCTMTKE